MLGWIDAHDCEPGTAHLLDAGSDDAIGLLQILSLAWLRLRIKLTTIATFRADVAGHADAPYWEK